MPERFFVVCVFFFLLGQDNVSGRRKGIGSVYGVGEKGSGICFFVFSSLACFERRFLLVLFSLFFIKKKWVQQKNSLTRLVFFFHDTHTLFSLHFFLHSLKLTELRTQ